MNYLDESWDSHTGVRNLVIIFIHTLICTASMTWLQYLSIDQYEKYILKALKKFELANPIL